MVTIPERRDTTIIPSLLGTEDMQMIQSCQNTGKPVTRAKGAEFRFQLCLFFFIFNFCVTVNMQEVSPRS